MRRAARVDKNQAEIVRALRDAGCAVLDISSVGGGAPDLIVSSRDGRLHLVEIKNRDARGRLNKLQQRWHESWAGEKPLVVYSVDDALRELGGIREQE